MQRPPVPTFPWQLSCPRCGLRHHPTRCPAWKAKCHQCHHKGHYARKCHTRLTLSRDNRLTVARYKSDARRQRDQRRLRDFLHRKLPEASYGDRTPIGPTFKVLTNEVACQTDESVPCWQSDTCSQRQEHDYCISVDTSPQSAESGDLIAEPDQATDDAYPPTDESGNPREEPDSDTAESVCSTKHFDDPNHSETSPQTKDFPEKQATDTDESGYTTEDSGDLNQCDTSPHSAGSVESNQCDTSPRNTESDESTQCVMSPRSAVSDDSTDDSNQCDTSLRHTESDDTNQCVTSLRSTESDDSNLCVMSLRSTESDDSNHCDTSPRSAESVDSNQCDTSLCSTEFDDSNQCVTSLRRTESDDSTDHSNQCGTSLRSTESDDSTDDSNRCDTSLRSAESNDSNQCVMSPRSAESDDSNQCDMISHSAETGATNQCDMSLHIKESGSSTAELGDSNQRHTSPSAEEIINNFYFYNGQVKLAEEFMLSNKGSFPKPDDFDYCMQTTPLFGVVLIATELKKCLKEQFRTQFDLGLQLEQFQDLTVNQTKCIQSLEEQIEQLLKESKRMQKFIGDIQKPVQHKSEYLPEHCQLLQKTVDDLEDELEYYISELSYCRNFCPNCLNPDLKRHLKQVYDP